MPYAPENVSGTDVHDIKKRMFWIASYPKSGNTWVRCLIASLKTGGAVPELSTLSDTVPYPVRQNKIEEILDVDISDLTTEERIFIRGALHRRLAGLGTAYLKTHDAFDATLFPEEISRGTFCIVRDPRDVAPSLAAQLGRSLDETIAFMAQQDAVLTPQGDAYKPIVTQRISSWSANVSSWLDQSPGPRLILRYEDLLNNTQNETRKLARFLGLPDDPQITRRAAASCRFEALREAEVLHGFSEKSKNLQHFFRLGLAGKWRETLSATQVSRIVADHGAVMSRLGYL